MKTWDAIWARRNLRYRPASLRGTARTILGKLAALDFRRRNGPRAADRAGESLGPRPEAHPQSAAPIVLVAKEPEDERHGDWLMYDFGQATANMMLAAAGLGRLPTGPAHPPGRAAHVVSPARLAWFHQLRCAWRMRRNDGGPWTLAGELPGEQCLEIMCWVFAVRAAGADKAAVSAGRKR
jgi:hypothetical protein